jgi:hypothetical protein
MKNKSCEISFWTSRAIAMIDATSTTYCSSGSATRAGSTSFSSGSFWKYKNKNEQQEQERTTRTSNKKSKNEQQEPELPNLDLLVPPWRNSFSCETLILDTYGNGKNMVPGMQDNFPQKCLGSCRYH